MPESLLEAIGLKIAVHYDTSLYAGGDYYDIVKSPDGKPFCSLLMADAEGHSAPAGMGQAPLT